MNVATHGGQTTSMVASMADVIPDWVVLLVLVIPFILLATSALGLFLMLRACSPKRQCHHRNEQGPTRGASARNEPR